MAQAIVDPQHVLQFAQTLKRYTSDVSGKTRDVHAKLHTLGGSWRDQEYQKFAKNLRRQSGPSSDSLPRERDTSGILCERLKPRKPTWIANRGGT